LNYQQLKESSTPLYFAFTYRQNANVNGYALRTGGHDALFSPGLGLLCSGMLVGFSLSASNCNKQNKAKESLCDFLLLGEKRSKLQAFLSPSNLIYVFTKY
jgi:hypothetical protein